MGESSLKEKTAKGLFWGGFSNGAQQLLNLGFGIVLARLLDASDYGMIGMLAIFSAIAGTLQESGFTVALANKQKVSHEDYNAVFWFSTLTGVGIYILLFFCAPFIADFYNNPDLTTLIAACAGFPHSVWLLFLSSCFILFLFPGQFFADELKAFFENGDTASPHQQAIKCGTDSYFGGKQEI